MTDRLPVPSSWYQTPPFRYRYITKCPPGTPRTKANFRYRSSSVILLALCIRPAGLDHAAQLELSGELLAEVGEVLHEALDDLDQGFFGRDGAVRLDANKEFRHVRVSD